MILENNIYVPFIQPMIVVIYKTFCNWDDLKSLHLQLAFPKTH